MMTTLLFFAACSKKSGPPSSSGSDTLVTTPLTNPIGTTKPHGGNCCLVSNTDDATKLIEVYDPADNTWTTPKWSWKPTTALGYTTADVALWAGGTDVKLRNNALFGQVVIAASYGIVTIAGYPDGIKKWSLGFTSDVQLHGVELLPNGNCLVANADPANGYFAVIASSQSAPNNMAYTTYRAPSAHAVLWDSSHNCVWALSDTLMKFTVGGTPEDPVLTLVSRYNLPTRWGHDLSAYTTDGNLMWVSTNSGTYIFNKTNGGFRAVAGDAQGTFVKGISDQPGKNQIVEAKQDLEGCTFDGWCTKTIRFYDLGSGAQTSTRTVNTAAFYKSKTFDPDYY
ncbi:MAG TPA: DUF6528 family protein [Puia sp.]|nr:DUF6528 family protein [Puia sp.]